MKNNNRLILGGAALLVASAFAFAAQTPHQSTAKQPVKPINRMIRQSQAQTWSTRYRSALAADAAGNFASAIRQYDALLADSRFGAVNSVRYSYGKLLMRNGSPAKAAEILKPAVVMKKGSPDIDAVDLYMQSLSKTQGPGAISNFYNEIRDEKMTTGMSLRDYNQQGLDDDQTMVFLRGREAENEKDYATAEREYRKVLDQYPASFLIHDAMIGLLSTLHRRNEIRPMFEKWYLHSDPEMKAILKKRTNLDFAKLDAMSHP